MGFLPSSLAELMLRMSKKRDNLHIIQCSSWYQVLAVRTCRPWGNVKGSEDNISMPRSSMSGRCNIKHHHLHSSLLLQFTSTLISLYHSCNVKSVSALILHMKIWSKLFSQSHSVSQYHSTDHKSGVLCYAQITPLTFSSYNCSLKIWNQTALILLGSTCSPLHK